METSIRQQLETYYQQRAERLETLKLDDVQVACPSFGLLIQRARPKL